MVITIRRVGGFAGFDEELGRVDTSSIAPQEASSLERLARAALAQASAQGEREVGADLLSYRISIREGASERTVVVPDSATDGEIGDLIREMSGRGQ